MNTNLTKKWKTVVGAMPFFPAYDPDLEQYNKQRGNGIHNMRDLDDNLNHIKTIYNFKAATLLYFLDTYVNTPYINTLEAMCTLVAYEAGGAPDDILILTEIIAMDGDWFPADSSTIALP